MFKKSIFCVIIFLLRIAIGFGQTPGLILKPALYPGNMVLDPDGDGYVSAKTNGIQIGFTIPPDNDVLQSEIPYVPIVRPDPLGDLMSGPTGSFGDIVGTDAAGNNAIMTYFDGTNMLFRFRVGDYSANSKGYSILIDTDQKFGFTGINSDPDAVAGNPGFEIEVALLTNFSVSVYNVNGTTNKIITASYAYETNCQKAKAISTASGNPDYFYDFFVPFSNLAALGITANTPLRLVAVTSNNPEAATGNNSVSDIGGVTSGSNLDLIYSNLVETISPTSTNNINTSGILERSVCPLINNAAVGNTDITGTSSEASGTVILVSVYESDGTTLKSSGTTTTTGTTWSIALSSFSPTLTLSAGLKVKAAATAAGKGLSYDNCSVQTVTDCSSTTGTNVSFTMISGGKGYTITNTFASGTIFTWYNADFTLAQYPIKSGSTTMITNPVVSTAANQTVLFSTSTGQTFPNGIYYFTFKEPGKCVSEFKSDCQYGITGASGIPTFTTTSLTPASTSVSGTCTSTPSPGATIYLYVDGVYRTKTTVINGTTWTISGLNFSSDLCKVVSIKEADGGKCPTAGATTLTISRRAVSPTINSTASCSLNPPSVISGFSTEIGATITLYRTSPTSGTLGTALVQSDGTWSVSGLSLSNNNVLVAAVTSGACLLPSANSGSITISTKTNVVDYTINFTTPIIQNSLSVSGTISGGSYPVTLHLFSDQVLIGAGLTINSPGSWTVSGLNFFDLSTGSTVQVKLTGNGCQSDFSSTIAYVQCAGPLDKTIETNSLYYCYNSFGTIVVKNSQPGILYAPYTDNGLTLFGYSSVGDGDDLVLTTFPLTISPISLKVKASVFPVGTCDVFMPGVLNISVSPLPLPPVAPSPQNYCATGTTTIADLAVTVPSGCAVRWYPVSVGGSEISNTSPLVNGTTYYAESYHTTTGCVSSSRTAVLVQAGSPEPPTASPGQTFCPGSVINDIVATLNGPGSINWYSNPSGGTALSGTTPLANNATYYGQTVQNSCTSSSRTAVTIYLNPVSGGTVASDQTIFKGGDPVAFTETTTSSGAGFLTYQWKSSTTSSTVGFSDISGANQPAFDPPAGLTMNTYYKRSTISTLNGVRCQAESNVLLISVMECISPTINIQPLDHAGICEEAGAAIFFVSASGTGLTFQWYVDGNTALNESPTFRGTTNDTLMVINPALTLNGRAFSVRITDLCLDQLTSQAATLTVLSNPAIAVGPVENTSVCEGIDTVFFSVSATGAGLSYQWYLNGTTQLTESSLYHGVNTNTLSIVNPSLLQSGQTYSVKLAGSCGSPVFSNPAALFVYSQPNINAMNVAVCSGDSFYISPVNGINGVVPTGTTYTWPVPVLTGDMTGGTAGSLKNSISGQLMNVSNLSQKASYTITPVVGSCAGQPFTLEISVAPKPVINPMTIRVCSGSEFSVSPEDGINGMVPSGTTYSWPAPEIAGGVTGGSPGNGASFVSGLLSNPTNVAQTATYTITPAYEGCHGEAFTLVVTIDPKPSINDFSVSVCSGESFSLAPIDGTNGIVPEATTYSWLPPLLTGGMSNGESGSEASEIHGDLVNPTLEIQTANYTITPVSGSCTGSNFTVNVSVFPNPDLRLIPDATICPGSSLTLTSTGAASYSWSPVSGLSASTGSVVSASPLSTTVYTVTGTDMNGCSASSSVTVKVEDLLFPVISCKPDIVKETDAGQCTAYLTSSDLAPASYSDNCNFSESNLSWVLSGANTGSGTGLMPATYFNTGKSDITYTITDGQAHQASCSFSVMVSDQVDPGITCVANLSRNVDFDRCYATIDAPSMAPLSFTDNCQVSESNLTWNMTGSTSGTGSGFLPQTAFNEGVTTIIYINTDQSGRRASCSFTVTVSDNIDPVISCQPNINVNVDPDRCMAAIGAAKLAPASFSENCQLTTENLIYQYSGSTTGSGTGVLPLTDFNTGTTTVIYTLTDDSGRSTGCSFSVIVSDNIEPILTCPSDTTVYVNLNCSFRGSVGTASLSDNCGVAGTISNNAPASFPLGLSTVTWSASDVYGNTKTCTQNVTVNNQAPIATDDDYSVLTASALSPSSVSGNVLLNDFDSEGQIITVTDVDLPASGVLTSDPNGIFIFYPPNGFTGIVTFGYTVCDACGQCDTGLVTIHVDGCIIPPSIPGPMKIVK